MTDDRHKPKPPENPAESAARILHEKIQEARLATREARQAAEDARRAKAELADLRDQIMKNTSSEVLIKRIEVVLNEIIPRFIEVGDQAKAILEQREAQLVERVAQLVGAKDKQELVKLIADMVAGEVIQVVAEVRREHEDTRSAVRDLTSLVDLIPNLTPRIEPSPVPPKAARKPSRSRSHNKRRRY